MTRARLLLTFLITILGQPIFAAETAAPLKLVSQKLDITGGELIRPENWSYSWDMHSQSVVWKLSENEYDSKQNLDKPSVIMQIFPETKRIIGKPPEKLAFEFLEQVKASGNVMNFCRFSTQNGIVKTCLETLEKSSKALDKVTHNAYAVSWDSKRGWLLLTTFSAPIERWEELSPIFLTISNVKIFRDDSNKKDSKQTFN